MYKLILKIYYFFTFGLILSSDIWGKGYALYSSIIFGLAYLFIFLINVITKRKKLKIFKEYKMIVLSINIYISYIVINTLIINPQEIFYVILSLIPLLVFICLLIDFSNYPNIRNEIINYLTYIFVGVSILSLIMFALGFSALNISFSFSFDFTSTSDLLSNFGERRLSWFMSHKSKYALFCLLGILLLITNNIMKTKYKILFILIEYINILCSSSLSVLASATLIIVFFINYKNMNRFIKVSLTIVLVGSFAFISFNLYNFFFINRNLSSLGSRIYIWDAAVKFIKAHPYGVVRITENDYLYTTFYGINAMFTNAHNQFLNEYMKNGIIGGSSFLFVYLYLFIKLIKINKKMIGFFIGTTLIMIMDVPINNEMLPIFWSFISLILTINYKHK